MSEPVEPAVALLFDDTELGAHLREALQQRGARIVHEGGVGDFNQTLLDLVNADVLVVNLDDTADDALDGLYDLMGGDRPRIVFNDAQASRNLDGWDRARWARHLAVKVMAEGDLDPARPVDARGIDVPGSPVADVSQPVATIEPGADASTPAPPAMPGEGAAETVAPSGAQASAGDDGHKQVASAESETLAAELEAILASGELPEDTDDSSSVEAPQAASNDGSPFPPGDDAIASGDSSTASAHDEISDDWLLSDEGAEDEKSEDTTEAKGQEPVAEGLDALFAPARDDVGDVSGSPAESPLDSLSLAPRADAPTATMASTDEVPPATATPAPISAPAEWALLDDAEPEPDASGQGEQPDASTFGIEKLSAAEFLAPDVEPGDDDSQPIMSLELVSLEEAVAPQAYQPAHEMVLDETGTALSRVVLLGAASSATDSVGDFLAALPETTRLTFLLAHHYDDDSAPSLLQRLSARSALPVRMAEDHAVARAGEVWIVPSETQVTLRRDGRIATAQLTSGGTSQSQAIDICLTMGAGAFGRDAVAIVFAGNGTDAVAGCQAVHDRGGRVWVESALGDYSADMVSGIFAEQLVDFSGTSQGLAAHLIEVFP